MGTCWSNSLPSSINNLQTTQQQQNNQHNMDGTKIRIVVTNALSPIGLATIQSLHKTFPQYQIRGGISQHATQTQIESLNELEVDPIHLNTSKRQSLIWSLVGIQSLLLIPSADDRLHTTLSYIAAAKTAGVKLITVVSTPVRSSDGILSYSSTPNIIERAVLKTKIGCCFVRLPFVIEDGKMNGGKFNSSCMIDGIHHSHLASISLTDVGSACATILANYQEHLFTRYDLFTSNKTSNNNQSNKENQNTENNKNIMSATTDKSSEPISIPNKSSYNTPKQQHPVGASATQSPASSDSSNSDSSLPNSNLTTPSPRTRTLSSEHVGQGTLIMAE